MHMNTLYKKRSDLYEKEIQKLTEWHFKNLIIGYSFSVSGQKKHVRNCLLYYTLPYHNYQLWSLPYCKDSNYPQIKVLDSCNSNDDTSWIFNFKTSRCYFKTHLETYILDIIQEICKEAKQWVKYSTFLLSEIFLYIWFVSRLSPCSFIFKS